MRSKVVGPENLKFAEAVLAVTAKTPTIENNLSDDQKVELITKKFEEIMDALGLDRSDDSLIETPRRIAEMYVHELFSGLKTENFPRITVIENKMKCDQMLVEKDVKVMSVCEHHFVTIAGVAHVAYIPNKNVIGLSKINRIVDYFSRRPQVQERLTKQIADALVKILETEDVAVFIDARHYCVISRGVQDHNSSTTTIDVRGVFRSKPEARDEFLKVCNLKR